MKCRGEGAKASLFVLDTKSKEMPASRRAHPRGVFYLSSPRAGSLKVRLLLTGTSVTFTQSASVWD